MTLDYSIFDCDDAETREWTRQIQLTELELDLPFQAKVNAPRAAVPALPIKLERRAMKITFEEPSNPFDVPVLLNRRKDAWMEDLDPAALAVLIEASQPCSPWPTAARPAGAVCTPSAATSGVRAVRPDSVKTKKFEALMHLAAV